MTISINKKEYELKSTLKAMIIYENIMEESFTPKGLKELMVYFYCVVIASNKDCALSYEEFVDFIDADPEVFSKFSQWLTSTSKVSEELKKE